MLYIAMNPPAQLPPHTHTHIHIYTCIYISPSPLLSPPLLSLTPPPPPPAPHSQTTSDPATSSRSPSRAPAPAAQGHNTASPSNTADYRRWSSSGRQGPIHHSPSTPHLHPHPYRIPAACPPAPPSDPSPRNRQACQ